MTDALDRRPQLAAALKAARKLKSPIIVAKLDRLSRDVQFINGLMSHKTPFIVSRSREKVSSARWLRNNLSHWTKPFSLPAKAG